MIMMMMMMIECAPEDQDGQESDIALWLDKFKIQIQDIALLLGKFKIQIQDIAFLLDNIKAHASSSMRSCCQEEMFLLDMKEIQV